MPVKNMLHPIMGIRKLLVLETNLNERLRWNRVKMSCIVTRLFTPTVITPLSHVSSITRPGVPYFQLHMVFAAGVLLHTCPENCGRLAGTRRECRLTYFKLNANAGL